jgi:hypothetical protein
MEHKEEIQVIIHKSMDLLINNIIIIIIIIVIIIIIIIIIITNSMAYGTRIHKGSPIILILSRTNPITRIDTYLFKVHSSHLRLDLPKGLFPVGLPVINNNNNNNNNNNSNSKHS